MRYLPVGLDIRGRPCVVIGGGAVGRRKVKSLLEAGGEVTLWAPEADPELRALAASGAIRWRREGYRDEALHGAFLAVVATDDQEVNAGVVGAARDRKVLVCDASSARRTQVIFGAVHREGGLTAALFSDGEDPRLSREARDHLAPVLAAWARDRDQGPGTREGRRGNRMLVLLAHGSRDPRWRGSLETLRHAVETGCPTEEVGLAFMQFQGPTLEEVIQGALARGKTSFRLLPLFMASAGHVEKDIVPLVAELTARFPGAELDLLTPIGENPLFSGLIQSITNEARSPGEE